MKKQLFLSSDFLKKIDLYREEILKWNKNTDLIGYSTEEEFFERHILNSLQLIPFLKKNDKIILDIGTGAGFPAMVCALYDPSRTYYLYEKKYQKRIFLKQISSLLNIQHIKIFEDFHIKDCPRADILTSRALLHLKEACKTLPIVKRIVLFKGKQFENEIKDLKETGEAFNISIHNGYDPDSMFIIV